MVVKDVDPRRVRQRYRQWGDGASAAIESQIADELAEVDGTRLERTHPHQAVESRRGNERIRTNVGTDVVENIALVEIALDPQHRLWLSAARRHAHTMLEFGINVEINLPFGIVEPRGKGRAIDDEEPQPIGHQPKRRCHASFRDRSHPRAQRG